MLRMMPIFIVLLWSTLSVASPIPNPSDPTEQPLPPIPSSEPIDPSPVPTSVPLPVPTAGPTSSAAVLQEFKNPTDNLVPAVVPILTYSSEHSPDGKYAFSFTTGDGKQAEESGYLRDAFIDNTGNPRGTQVVQGSYSYISPDGTPIQVSYIADENGFQPTGIHFPANRKSINPFDQDNRQIFNSRFNPYNPFLNGNGFFGQYINGGLLNPRYFYDPRNLYNPRNFYDPIYPYGPRYPFVPERSYIPASINPINNNNTSNESLPPPPPPPPQTTMSPELQKDSA